MMDLYYCGFRVIVTNRVAIRCEMAAPSYLQRQRNSEGLLSYPVPKLSFGAELGKNTRPMRLYFHHIVCCRADYGDRVFLHDQKRCTE